ncbi:MAG: dinitrogenase iron-molybdenum cofactor biosynthesis protein [Magnetospiraceae bacterium]
MSDTPMTREMALRIGLAARALPDTTPAKLLAVLDAAIGLPPAEDKIQKLRLKDLRTALDGEFSEMPKAALEEALSQLKGAKEEAPLPTAEAFTEGDMPGSIRVACASNTGEALDGHFGSCARFLVYQVAPDTVRLIDIRDANTVTDVEDKNDFRADLIADCHVLYVASIGGAAAAKVIKRDIQPVKIPAGGSARDLAMKLAERLETTPPPWLAKIMGVSAEDRAPVIHEVEE